MNNYTLYPTEGQKSFYGKARLSVDHWNNKVVYSYDTPVAMLDGNGTLIRLWGGYSPTTLRHVNAFLAQNGMNKLGRKAWEAMPVRNPLRYGL